MTLLFVNLRSEIFRPLLLAIFRALVRFLAYAAYAATCLVGNLHVIKFIVIMKIKYHNSYIQFVVKILF